MFIEHDGFFIYVAAGYAGSDRVSRVFRFTDLARYWRKYFSADDNSLDSEEYLLGHPGYIGLKNFSMRRIDALGHAGVATN